MKIDEADMASATDVGRNTGRYISQAADGRRIVIMNNHQPVAAIIGMADLRRLDALDIPVRAATPTTAPGQNVSLTNLDPMLGKVPVGRTHTGQTAYIDPLEHLLVVGTGASDMIGPLLAGVATDGLDTAFVVATDQPIVIAHPEGPRPRIVALATGINEAGLRRLTEQLLGELAARTELLHRHEVNTIDQYRRFRDGPEVDHLIVVIDHADALLRENPDFNDVVDDILDRGDALNATVWLFSEARTPRTPPQAASIAQRIALPASGPIESREIIGCADAVNLTAGQAILRTATETLTGITTFVRDDALPPTPLITVGPPIEWPSIQQPPSLQQVLRLAAEQPNASPGRFAVPIGVLDDPRAHRLVPFALDLGSGGVTNIACAHGNRAVRVFLDAIFASSAQLYTPEELQFHYVGGLSADLLKEDLPNLASAHEGWGGSATSMLTATIAEAMDTDSGPHIVLIVDAWDPLTGWDDSQDAVKELREEIRRVLQVPGDKNPGVHIVSINRRTPVTERLLLEKSRSYVHLSGADPAWAMDATSRKVLRRLPDDPHHAAVSQGHLVLATA